MDENIVNRVVELQEDVIKIKQVQRSQNDSFKFYAYQTDNLWNALPHGTGTTVHLEFRPTMKQKDKVVCRFYAEDGSAVQYYAEIDIDPTNHLKATYLFYGYDPPTSPPSFERFCYLGCYTNCEGELIWSV